LSIVTAAAAGRPWLENGRPYPVAALVSLRVTSRPTGFRFTRVIGTFRMIESKVKINDEL
jgi:hypothetical protein